MATGQIQLPAPAAATRLEAVSWEVQVMEEWEGEWVTVPHLQPLRYLDAVAPSVGSATLLWHYGLQLQQGATALAVEQPQDLANWFVRIRKSSAAGTQVAWVGFLPSESLQMLGAPGGNATGHHELHALDLKHLLDRTPIRSALILLPDGTVGQVDRVPAANSTGKIIVGNMSAVSYGYPPHPGGIRVWDPNGIPWTHSELCRTLLWQYTPAGLVLALGGQATALQSLTVSPYPLEGVSLKAALDHLIPRELGLGWTIRTDGEGVVIIHVFTHASQPVSVAGYTLPANAEAHTLALDGRHELAAAVKHISHLPVVDRVVAVGAPVRTIASYALLDQTLEAGWPPTLEAKYNTGSADPEAEPQDHDTARKARELAPVFCRFTVPQDWDGLAGNGEGGTKTTVSPSLDATGEPSFATAYPLSPRHKRFLRHLPILETIPGGHLGGTYRPPLAVVQDPAEKWHDLATITMESELEEPSRAAQCRVNVLDWELGVQLDPQGPNHIIALGHFNPLLYASATEPAVNFSTLIVTAAIETDKRLTVEAARPVEEQSPHNTALYLDVPGAHLDVILPGTVLGVTAAGELEREEGTYAGGGEPDTPRIIRSDIPRLSAAAAGALAWHGQPRAQVELQFSTVVEVAAPGSMILSLGTTAHAQQIATVVTAREVNCAQQSTTLRTGYHELQFTGIQDFPGLSDPRTVARHVRTLQESVAALQAEIARLPVVYPSRAAADNQAFPARLVSTGPGGASPPSGVNVYAVQPLVRTDTNGESISTFTYAVHPSKPIRWAVCESEASDAHAQTPEVAQSAAVDPTSDAIVTVYPRLDGGSPRVRGWYFRRVAAVSTVWQHFLARAVVDDFGGIGGYIVYHQEEHDASAPYDMHSLLAYSIDGSGNAETLAAAADKTTLLFGHVSDGSFADGAYELTITAHGFRADADIEDFDLAASVSAYWIKSAWVPGTISKAQADALTLTEIGTVSTLTVTNRGTNGDTIWASLFPALINVARPSGTYGVLLKYKSWTASGITGTGTIKSWIGEAAIAGGRWLDHQDATLIPT